jgi:integrase
MNAPGDLVFPRPDGSMHHPTVGWDDALRRAMARAGLMVGYRLGCRAWRCGYEGRADLAPADGAPCPTCGKPTVYSAPMPRHLTFKDLRHTTATLLRKAGVPLSTVQRILRHSDPKLTDQYYAHLETEDMRESLELMADRLALAGANRALAGRIPATGQDEGPETHRFREEPRGLHRVGATGFEPATTCTPSKCATRLRYAPGTAGTG